MEYGTQNRNIQYDLLRILAAFSVVMLHSAAQYWYDLPIDGRAWKTVNAYDACFRFGVPIFVMISGAIFLDPKRELDVKRLYRHNMLRLAVIYLLWGAAYGLMDCYHYGFANLTWKDILKEMASGRYHLWYLPMLVGFMRCCRCCGVGCCRPGSRICNIFWLCSQYCRCFVLRLWPL